MHPFDIKSALLAKHAQHVVLIHFPVALFLVGFLFDLVAQRTRNRALAAAAYYNIVGAALSTIPVLITGVLAWLWALGGHKLKGILLDHLVLASMSSAFIWIAAWLHYRANRQDSRPLSAYRLALEFLAATLLMLTGHLGGFLSGVNLPG